MDDKHKDQIDRNFTAFEKKLSEVLKTHAGKFALMHNGEIIEYFDTVGDAHIFGRTQYPDGMFSVQRVVSDLVDLGYFSHVVHHVSV